MELDGALDSRLAYQAISARPEARILDECGEISTKKLRNLRNVT
jgi:hypothetical protein